MLQPECVTLLLAVIGLIAVGLVAYVRSDKAEPITGETPMPPRRVQVLTIYLLLFGVFLVFMLVSLTALDFPQTALAPLEAPIPTPSPTPAAASGAPTTPGATPTASPTPTPTPTPTPSQSPSPVPTPVVPVLIRVFPQVTVGSTPNERLALYGKNFTDKSKVRFNMEALPTEFFSDTLIRVRLEPANLVGKGSITVDVINPDTGAISNAIPVPIEKPQVKLNLLLFHPDVTREVQLLLLVIFAGALGSYLHAIMSLTDYVAKRNLETSWFWWYMSRPFLGMAMALVFYAVLRGGFLAGTPADANVVNPYGVLTVGALVGMFSYKAAQKLGEIFDVVFKATVPAADSDAPIITALQPSPDPIIAGTNSNVTVEAIGIGMNRVAKLLLDTKTVKPKNVGEKTLIFTLIPSDMTVARDIKVMGVTSSGAISEPVTLTVHEPPGQGGGAAAPDGAADGGNGDAGGGDADAANASADAGAANAGGDAGAANADADADAANAGADSGAANAGGDAGAANAGADEGAANAGANADADADAADAGAADADAANADVDETASSDATGTKSDDSNDAGTTTSNKDS